MKLLILLACLVGCVAIQSCASAHKNLPVKPLVPNSESKHLQLKPTKITPPTWPLKYLRSGQEGWITVGFNLSPKGKPSNLNVIDSSPEKIFDEIATDAIKNWRFKIPQDYDENNIYVYSLELKIEK